jgi:transcriptional regulator GlxA family with amidase domain
VTGQTIRTRPAARSLSVGILLAPKFTLGALGNFVDVLRLASDEGDRSRQIHCRWQILSGRRDPVASSSGIMVSPDGPYGQPGQYDYIAVIGGLIDERPTTDPDMAAFLHLAARQKVPLIGICTGAFILYRLGLMEGYRCCINWFHHNDFMQEFAGLEPVSDSIYVVDRDRLTCSGGSSAAHLAAFLVDRHVGSAAARKSLAIMIFDQLSWGDRPQPGVPSDLQSSDPLVRRAILIMQQSLALPPGTASLARTLGVSRRTLERRIKASLGLTAHRLALMIRMTQAKFLLLQRSFSITQIAADTGFCDTSHFIRAFRRTEGMSPQKWQNQTV